MFYDRFKFLCDQKGVSCNKAAIDMGLSNSTPTKWKKTGATPDSKTLSAASAYFGVPISYLLTGEQKEKAPAENGERMSDDELKFALWGDSTEMDDADLDDVKRYAAFIRDRKRGK